MLEISQIFAAGMRMFFLLSFERHIRAGGLAQGSPRLSHMAVTHNQSQLFIFYHIGKAAGGSPRCVDHVTLCAITPCTGPHKLQFAPHDGGARGAGSVSLDAVLAGSVGLLADASPHCARRRAELLPRRPLLPRHARQRRGRWRGRLPCLCGTDVDRVGSYVLR